MAELGVRWTIGDVARNGFEALRLSIWGAFQLFGARAAYAVCVNTLPLAEARARVGDVPRGVQWIDASHALPQWLRQHLDPGLAEGAAWKLAPVRVFQDRKELSLDNDCILWRVPPALRDWLEDDDSVLVAEDVRSCLGAFAELCGDQPRNLGLRGLPVGFDLETAMLAVLRARPRLLASELDEQGLQLAALLQAPAMRVASVEDVTICSPFPPHRAELGRCGAHFCGLNAKRSSFSVEGKPATAFVAELWTSHLDELRARVGAPHRLESVEEQSP